MTNDETRTTTVVDDDGLRPAATADHEPDRTITAEVLDVLRANAAVTETAGRLAPASLAALRTAGAFSTARTTAAAQDPRAVVADLQAIGAACPASAWIVALTTAVTGLLPFASGQAAAAVAAAEAPVVENFAPGALTADPRGFVLSGSWPYSSGSEVASYAMLGALFFEDGRPPRMRMAVVPTSQLGLVRTWDVAGLQGTGSHTLVAEGVEVPADSVFDLPVDPDVTGRAVLLTTTLTSAAIIGMAKGALQVVTDLVHGDRGPSRTRYASFAESPGARALYTGARARIQSAAERVEAVATALADHAAGGSGAPLDRLARMDLRRTLVTAVREARSAVDDLCDLHGSSAFTRSNPLQRFWRDIGVGSRHGGLRGYILDEDLARTLVGQDDLASPMW